MPARTKSCATCRKKRIKCDATLPTCLMCLKFGRTCPGVSDGPVIVDMTQTARHGMQKRTRKDKLDVGTERVESRPIEKLVHHVSPQAVVTEAFYARFLSYWTSEGEGKDLRNKRTWLHRLPSLSMDGQNDALVLALQATASSYCAMDLLDPALTRHAWVIYGQAVQKHSRYLAKTTRGKAEMTIHMISTSVLLSFFEAMQTTSVDAYRSHIYGAAKMFEDTDPRQCHEGVLCQIFFHLRTQMAFVQLTANGQKTPVNVHKILRETLSYEELPMFQRLTTHVTTLADTYNDMRSIGIDTDRKIDLVQYMTTKTSIDTLWSEYNDTASIENETLSWLDPSTGLTNYRDPFTALTIAYFSAARVLLSLLAPRLAVTFLDMHDHFGTILDAASFLQTYEIGCAFMRMAAPLLLVALHSPLPEQRAVAEGCFASWIGGSMRGISALAMETMRSHRVDKPWKSPSSEVGSVVTDEGICMLVDAIPSAH